MPDYRTIVFAEVKPELILIMLHVSVCFKEILEEVKKELHSVKEEIIAGE